MSLLLLVWPALVFAAIRGDWPWLGCVAIIGLGAQFLWPALLKARLWALLGLALIALASVSVAIVGEARAYLHILPVMVFLLLALFFGRTLRPGSVPLVTRIAAAARNTQAGEIDAMQPGLYRYTRRITALWTAGFVFFAVEDVLLMSLALPARVVVLINVANFVVVLALLMIEYLYHSRRYPNPTHRHVGDFIRDIARYDYRQLYDD